MELKYYIDCISILANDIFHFCCNEHYNDSYLDDITVPFGILPLLFQIIIHV